MKDFQDFTSCENCYLQPHSIFRHLNKEDLQKFSFEKENFFYKRGTYIYHEGNRLSGVYCICKGILKIFKTGIDGREQIIKLAKPGDIIAFRSILTGELACTSAKVIEDCTLCFIPSETLIYFIKNNPNFSLEIIQISCKELDEANSYITDIAQKTVRERLAEILIHLKDTFGLDKEQYLQITLTREELANMVGTATETVIRLLSEFKQDNLIELQGRHIKILDSGAINRIAST
jgi:CRP/FNR family transcriptional regulator, polysaccharide utilization system transcription regulator